MIAKIHTLEWTVALFGSPFHEYSQRFLWYGILGKPMPVKSLRKLKNSFLSGYPGSRVVDEKFQHSEEFISVYKFHSILPDKYCFNGHNYDVNEIHNWYKICYKDNTLDHVMKYLLNERPGQLVLHNYPKVISSLNKHGEAAEVDLALIDVVRNRKRNLPKYNDFRKGLGLKLYCSLDELLDEVKADSNTVKQMKHLYNDDINEVDLQVGLLIEPKMRGCAVGETTYAVFTVQTQKRLSHDRFFTTNFNSQFYTSLGMEMITNVSMKDILRRHHPNIITQYENVFKNQC
jgi:alpha-dioxygenase